VLRMGKLIETSEKTRVDVTSNIVMLFKLCDILAERYRYLS
jgi:hypothetical protein